MNNDQQAKMRAHFESNKVEIHEKHRAYMKSHKASILAHMRRIRKASK